MKRTIAIVSTLCAALVVQACVAKRYVRIAPLFADDPYWSRVVAKDEAAVLVTEGDLRRKYHPIARILVESVGRERERSFARMRQEAAKIGADAIIQIKVSSQYEGQRVNVYTGQNLGPRNRHTLEGLAVIFEEADSVPGRPD